MKQITHIECMHGHLIATYNSVSGAGQGELAITFEGVGDNSCIT